MRIGPLGAPGDNYKPLGMLTGPLGLDYGSPEAHRPLGSPWDTYRPLGILTGPLD